MDPIIRAADLASVRRLPRAGAAAQPLAAVPPAASVTALAPVAPAEPVRPATPSVDQWQALEQRTQAVADGEASLRQGKAALAAQEEELRERLAGLEQREQELARDLEARRAAAEERGRADAEQQLQERLAAVQQDVQAQSAAQAAQLEQVLAALLASRSSLLAEADDLLVEVVHGALCRMLGESGAARALVAATVAEVLREVRDNGPVQVYLHPGDMDLLQGLAGGGANGRLQLLADSRVTLGGCLVETARGTLDARLELQLQALREALLAARRARATVGVAD